MVADLAFAIVHADDPSRVGDVFFVPRRGAATLGRGSGDDHVTFLRQRPGRNLARPPLASPFLSREQLKIERAGERTVRIDNVGKCALYDDRWTSVTDLEVSPGQAFALGDSLVLLCVERPPTLPPCSAASAGDLPFGEADAARVVGESAAAWRLRETLAFVGARSAHVLIFGPSGSGKELAAQAIHRYSARSSRALVARNASTLPAGLIEAELFGNVANYPSQGMPERPGLVGEAHGSTLFLDEIGELTEELSTRLLRLLDDPGDYQRLGDARRRTADVRVIGATNRPPSKLREDVLARFKLRITMPGLDARREDIPLIARQLMRRIASQDAGVKRRFFADDDASGASLRIAPELVLALVTHAYTTHVRELDALLWIAIASSDGDTLALTPEVRAELRRAPAPAGASVARTELPGLDAVREALARAGGVQEKAWRELGLANRHVLKRLIRKYGLDPRCA